MDRALQDRRAAGRQSERADEQGEKQERGPLSVKAERQLLPEIKRNPADDWNGQTNGGERRAEREIEAGLDAIGVRGFERGGAFGQENEGCDDDAEEGGRQANGMDRLL